MSPAKNKSAAPAILPVIAHMVRPNQLVRTAPLAPLRGVLPDLAATLLPSPALRALDA